MQKEKRDPIAYLMDILESIDLIYGYIQPHTEESFAANTVTQDAVIRRIEIIGEAVKQLPMVIRDAHPDIPWRDIAGMRDVLIHEYYQVDLPTAWKVVTRDLPKLKRQLEELIEKIS